MKAVFARTVRNHLRATTIWGTAVGVLLFVIVTGYYAQFGTDIVARQQALAEMMVLMESVRLIAGEPINIFTGGGFVTWRTLNFLPLIIGLWAILLATATTRGEEQCGATDLLLTTPHTRTQVLLGKWFGLVALALVLGGLMCLGLFVGSLPFEPLSFIHTSLAIFNITAHAVMWGTASMVVAQWVRTRRGAAGITTLLMFIAWFANNVAETLQSLGWLKAITPFAAYAANKPLTDTWVLNAPAFALPIVLSGLLVIAAIVLFQRRDLGEPMLRLRERRAAGGEVRSIWLRNVFTKTLRDQRVSTLVWGIGIGLFGALILALAPLALDTMRSFFRPGTPIGDLFGQLATIDSFIGLGFFYFLPLMIVIFAITQVSAWTSEEQNGQLDLTLSTPHARTAVLLRALGAFALGSVVLIGLVAVFVFGAGVRLGIAFDRARVFAGLVAALPLAWIVLTAGFALAAFLPRVSTAVAMLSALVALSFFGNLLAPMLKVPEAVQALSIFYLYGTPMQPSWSSAGAWAMLVLSVVFVVLAVIGFRRRDLAR